MRIIYEEVPYAYVIRFEGKERNPIEYDNPIELMATLEDPSGERYVEFIEWDGYEWDDFYTDDNERGVWGYDKIIAWTKKPEPFKGDLNVNE